MSVGASLSYRSPVSKLLRFFRLSRDKWKEKCKAAKRENKSLKYRLAKMTESRDRWKAKARGSGKAPQGETAPVQEGTTKKHAERRSRDRGRRHARPGVGAAG